MQIIKKGEVAGAWQVSAKFLEQALRQIIEANYSVIAIVPFKWIKHDNTKYTEATDFLLYYRNDRTK